MAKNAIIQVGKPGGEFELVEREIVAPGAGEVRIKVLACGVCHSNAATKEGMFPWIQYPRVPGHEVAGVIDEVGTQMMRLLWREGPQLIATQSPITNPVTRSP